MTPDFAGYVFDDIYKAGTALGLRLVGGEALNALRIEKGFVHWGHDMAYTEAPHQLGLDFACKPDRKNHFIGRDAYLARRSNEEGPYLCLIRLCDSDAILHHNEPVLRDGAVVRFITNGAFAYAQNTSVGLCMVSSPAGSRGRTSVKAGTYAVLVEGEIRLAQISLTAFATALPRQ